jgi:signal transduction histidine kinase
MKSARKNGCTQFSAEDLHNGFMQLIDGLQAGLVLLDDDLRCIKANSASTQILGRNRDELFSVPFDELFEPGERAGLRERLLDFRTEGRCWNGRLLTADDTERAVRGHTIPLSGGAASMALEFRDDTESVRLQRESSALMQIANRIAYTGSFESMMNELADSVRQAVKCVACTVTVAAPAPQLIKFAGISGLPDDYVKHVVEAWRQGMPSATLDAINGGRIVTARLERDKAQVDPRLAPLHDYYRTAPWDLVAAVPMRYRDKVMGTVNCYFQSSREPTDAELRFLKAIADQAGLAVENARLIQEVQGKAASVERQRLARELHDSVSQALYGIALGAHTAREMAERATPELLEPLDYVVSLAEAGLAEMRALIFELRPEALESEGLVSAIEKQVMAVGARHKLEARTELSKEPPMPLELKQELYRLVQEALHNTVKHARARRLHVSLTESDGALRLRVEDDGVGFDPGADYPGHLGLKTMRERVESLGGTLDIDSRAGAGTRLVVRVPATWSAS